MNHCFQFIFKLHQEINTLNFWILSNISSLLEMEPIFEGVQLAIHGCSSAFFADILSFVFFFSIFCTKSIQSELFSPHLFPTSLAVYLKRLGLM